MANVELSQTLDGGELTLEGSTLKAGPGLKTMAYLLMFGGDETGTDWWGDPGSISRTQAAILGAAKSTRALVSIRAAAVADLARMVSDGVVNSVGVEVTSPEYDELHIAVDFGADNTVKFILNWDAAL